MTFQQLKNSGFQVQLDTVMLSFAVRSDDDIDEIRTLCDKQELEITDSNTL